MQLGIGDTHPLATLPPFATLTLTLTLTFPLPPHGCHPRACREDPSHHQFPTRVAATGRQRTQWALEHDRLRWKHLRFDLKRESYSKTRA